jgi:predicted metalloprotease
VAARARRHLTYVIGCSDLRCARLAIVAAVGLLVGGCGLGSSSDTSDEASAPPDVSSAAAPADANAESTLQALSPTAESTEAAAAEPTETEPAVPTETAEKEAPETEEEAPETTTATAPPDAVVQNPGVARMPPVPAGGVANRLPRPGLGETRFMRAAFDSSQSLWRRQFAAARLPYEPAHLVFFHTNVTTDCGPQDASAGPFYCPADQTVYLNTDLFDRLGRRFGLESPFAAGYIVGHEVGHHVQQQLGTLTQINALREADPAGVNARSVRLELQADCYAGVWLHSVSRAGELTRADVRDILNAAAIVGDDFQRQRAGVPLEPETWTHGSSAQRTGWVSRGKDSGRPAVCDTFAGS